MPLPQNPNIKDIINALEDLEGINQKTELASVIGFPAIPSETIAQQIVSLISGKQTIVNALNSKDISADISESIEDLGQKINSVTPGINYLSGVTTSSANNSSFQIYSGTTNVNKAYIEVGNLGFLPKLIIIYPEIPSEYTTKTEYYRQFSNNTEYVNLNAISYSNITSASSIGFKAQFSPSYVNDNGFLLPVTGTNTRFIWEAYG